MRHVIRTPLVHMRGHRCISVHQLRAKLASTTFTGCRPIQKSSSATTEQ